VPKSWDRPERDRTFSASSFPAKSEVYEALFEPGEDDVLLGGGRGLTVSRIATLNPDAEEFRGVPAGWIPRNGDVEERRAAAVKLLRMDFERIRGTRFHGLSCRRWRTCCGRGGDPGLRLRHEVVLAADYAICGIIRGLARMRGRNSMLFDDRLEGAVRDGDDAQVRRLVAGACRAKLAELALSRRLPEWVAALVREEKGRREQGRATTDPLAAAIACPTKMRLRDLREDRDDWSCTPLAELRRRVPAGARHQVFREWPDAGGDDLAEVFRWVLRGLPPDLSCRKVRLSRPAGPRPDVAARAAGAQWGPGPRGGGSTAWLGALIRALGPHAAVGPLGIRCREDSGRWEVLVCLRRAEPAWLDLRRLYAAFDRVDRFGWQASGICLEGLYAGREVRLRVAAFGPEGEEAGQFAVADQVLS
jgi:hypothetical protein